MSAERIYLDYNATAPVRPEVIDLVGEIMATVGNASSVHAAGRVARERVETARDQVARLVNADRENVIFTSGGTESDNLALRGFGERQLIVAASEHGAVLAPSLLYDADCIVLPVDGQGLVDLAALEQALATAKRPVLVSIMLANNETGVIQPVAEIADRVHAHEGIVHCDAVQAAGKISVDIKELRVDALSLSGHKIGGPQGVGALVLREDRVLRAQIVGGGQERGRRSGTENVAGVAGFGLAAELALKDLANYAALAERRDRMEREILTASPETRIYSAAAPRLPNTSCLTMPGVKSETQIMLFDMDGIALSAGSACSSGKIAVSHVLDAMGASEAEAACAIRISLGWGTTDAHVDALVQSWRNIFERCGSAAHAA